MKITLITACYNSVGTIRTAIESVLSQKGVDIEYIIVPTARTFAPSAPTASGPACRSSTSSTSSRFGGLCLEDRGQGSGVRSWRVMFLTRIPRARSASPRSGCPSRGEAQRRVTAPRIELASRLTSFGGYP